MTREQVMARLAEVVEAGLEPKMAYDKEGNASGTSGYCGLQAARGALMDIAALEGYARRVGGDDETPAVPRTESERQRIVERAERALALLRGSPATH